MMEVHTSRAEGRLTVVEFTTQEPGTYTIVDHSLGRMEKGAAAGPFSVDVP
jgi:hypothetical protein